MVLTVQADFFFLGIVQSSYFPHFPPFFPMKLPTPYPMPFPIVVWRFSPVTPDIL